MQISGTFFLVPEAPEKAGREIFRKNASGRVYFCAEAGYIESMRGKEGMEKV